MTSSSGHHVVVGGSGAVGTVVVDSLLRAGERVTVYLKAKHAERLRSRRRASGSPVLAPFIAVYDHNQRQHGRILTAGAVGLVTCVVVALLYQKSVWVTAGLSLLLTFATFVSLPHSIAPYHLITAFDVITSVEDVPASTTCLWLCFSSFDLRADSEQLKALLASIPSHALVVTCTPSPFDRAFLLSLFPHPRRIILCMVGFLAYQAPLVAEEIPTTHDANVEAPQGIARYFPPFTSTLLHSLEPHLSHTLAQTLTRGGLPSKAVKEDPHIHFALPIALLHPLLLALELSSWSLSQLFSPAHSHTLQMATAAMKECAPPGRLLSLLLSVALWPSVLRAGLFLALTGLPFDGEAYLVFHGTKVSEQTVLIVKDLEERAEREGRPMPHTRRLRERVERRRGDQEKRSGSRW